MLGSRNVTPMPSDRMHPEANPHAVEHDATPGPCQVHCGRVLDLVVDVNGGLVWVRTSTHALTLELPQDSRQEDLPRIGEPAFHNEELDVVGIGARHVQRTFGVARRAWHVEAGEGDDGVAGLAGLTAVSVLLWLAALALLASALFHAAQGLDLTTQLARAAVAMVAVVTVTYWKAAVPTWCYRQVIGVAERTDLAAAPRTAA